MKQRFLNGILSGGLGFIVKTIVMLLLTPQMVMLLGVKLYGAYLLYVGFSELLMLAATGMTTGFIQNYSKALAINDKPLGSSILISARWVYCILASAVITIGWFILPSVITQLFKSGTYPNDLLLLVGHLVLLTAGVNILLQYLSSILLAHFLHKQVNVIETCRGMLEAIFAVIILKAGWGFTGIFYGRFLIAAVCMMLLGWIAWKNEPALKSTWYKLNCSFNGMKELFQVSLFAMISKISIFIAHRMDEFVIASFLTLSDVTCFGLVMRIIGQIAALMIKLAEGTTPFFSRLASQNNVESSRYLFLRSTAFIHFMVCLLLMLVMGGFPEFIQYMGDGKVQLDKALPIAFIACGTIWTGSIQIPASSYLFSSGMYRFQTTSTVITCLCNLGLSIFLIQLIGLPGVILGTLIPHVIQNHLITIFCSLKKLSIAPVSFIKQVYLQTLPPLLVAFMLISSVRFAGKYFFNANLLPMTYLILALTICCLVSCSVWLKFCLDKREKQLLGGLFSRLPFFKNNIASPDLVNS